MHLLATTPGRIDDGGSAVDLGQSPAELVFLSAADSEIACFAAAQSRRLAEDETAPALRLANLMRLSHPYSVDLYIEQTLVGARLVVCRLLGGCGYWPYGVEQITAFCRKQDITLIWLPGDDRPDEELAANSTAPRADCHLLWRYCLHGGMDNALNGLRFMAEMLRKTELPRQPPAPLLRAGIYWPGATDMHDPAALPRHATDAPASTGRVALIFYRALLQAGDLAPVDAMIDALHGQGLDCLPLYVSSLKDPVAAATVADLLARGDARLVLNATGFALGTPGSRAASTPFDGIDAPVLQVIFSGGDRPGWEEGTWGLSARDIAMNVALPEVDGRILSRAVSFKGAGRRDAHVQTDIIRHEPVPDRCHFVARMAAGWRRLAATPAAERRVAFVLANYPNRDARMGNGVGLDTPAGLVRVLDALHRAGYDAPPCFADGDALIRHLKAGPTNSTAAGREIREHLPLDHYNAFFTTLPEAVRRAVTERWGPAAEDPFFCSGKGKTEPGFALPLFRIGHMAIGLQPARGYNIDPEATYHDPALPPPHNYIAFYAWLARHFDAHAMVHMGKHGNLEWLPGKALALSESCFPEALFGAIPHLYPFIVNDPGEGAQAKRRTQAVIVDHLTPPLTRAESYGPLLEMERLIDEFYDATGLDARRVAFLQQEILDLAHSSGLDRDCGVAPPDADAEKLAKLDNYLCALKEHQIRDGLHIFGLSPTGTQRRDLLLALARAPRHDGTGGNMSLHRALANDFDLTQSGFDPLDTERGAAPWTGPRPPELCALAAGIWRSTGDTIERIELFAQALLEGKAEPPGPATAAVMESVTRDLAPDLDASGAAEIAALKAGLAGRFVAPGPSGAPTRGRPDVLPTGRNFYSVDTRTVPTPTAWKLGWKSAQLLLETHAQTHGVWPRQIALSCWGTANMRTGGDDIAQALALMGVRPTWDGESRRVTGFEIMPPDTLDRPRVDVTLRISGFFRDAFPMLVDLVDSAARAVAALDEPAAVNPLAACVREETATLTAQGLAPAQAAARAGARVYGAKPGAYGAGLQALIDERCWESDADLATAYLAWGGYAYGAGAEGTADREGFARRLGRVEAVIHNQDNREHDILDSDDYYQFQGGLAVAVRTLSGTTPALYHGDHSRPEAPRIRTLQAEIARVVRARVVNPKWIAGVMRHGYKGGFEMAATVDYMFAFAATARAVGDHHFDAVYDAWLEDETVRCFLAAHNPDALHDIIDRLREARQRGLWTPRRNDVKLLEQPAGTRAGAKAGAGSHLTARATPAESTQPEEAGP